jgi:hypothetical protein
VRENSWQVAFRADLGRARPRWLPWHDRWFRPLVSNPIGDVLATTLVCAWFFAWLPVRLATRRRPSATH